MPLDDHLLRNEQILASAKAASGGFLYATNQRVIKYNKGLLSESAESLSYSHIVAASNEKHSFLWAIVVGIVVISVGFVIASFLGNILEGIEIFVSAIGWLVVLFGFVLVLLGIFGRAQFYQIKAVGLSEVERQNWRTAGVDDSARTLAHVDSRSNQQP